MLPITLLVLSLIGSLVGSPAALQQGSAEALLARSIEFHDPQGQLSSNTVRLTWNGTNPEGESTTVAEMAMSPDGRFEMNGRIRGAAIEYATVGSTMTVRVDGTVDIDAETSERLRLARDGGMFWRDYFGYLAGLPMKLRDPGTIIDPQVTATDFMGRAVQSIRVTYSSEVGGDTWYFYFDPDSAELVGCRFYHDEAANDGEYITFEGLAEGGGMRLPQTRRWYTNAEDRFLGQDVIGDLAVGR